MIIKSSENIRIIQSYLDAVSEDQFINEIVIPLFTMTGYSKIRVNSHGPGEHGKDLIFMRFVPAFLDFEYVVVQAKSEKITSSNITEMSHQLIRALRTPIVGQTNGKQVFTNYVVFINSRTITNDAEWEFPYLIDGKNNIKLLSQDTVCSLILDYSIIPDTISSQITTQSTSGQNDINSKILTTLYANNNDAIDNLFQNVIPISKFEISAPVKKTIVEYIFNQWRQDKSWSGTVRPMKWLDTCIDFLDNDQSHYILEILYEYTTLSPSFVAQPHTSSVVKKITPLQLFPIANEYLAFVLNHILHEHFIVLLTKLSDLSCLPNFPAELKPVVKDLERFSLLWYKLDLSEDEKNERIILKESLSQKNMQYLLARVSPNRV